MATKKRIKFEPTPVITGDLAGARHLSWTYLAINNSPFTPIYRPIDVRMMWLDPFLTQWEGAHSRQLINSLDSRHQWLEILMKGPATPAEVSPNNPATEAPLAEPALAPRPMFFTWVTPHSLTWVPLPPATEPVAAPSAEPALAPRPMFFTWVTPHSLTWVPLPPATEPIAAPSTEPALAPRPMFFTWVTPHSLTWVPLPPATEPVAAPAADPTGNISVNK